MEFTVKSPFEEVNLGPNGITGEFFETLKKERNYIKIHTNILCEYGTKSLQILISPTEQYMKKIAYHTKWSLFQE